MMQWIAPGMLATLVLLGGSREAAAQSHDSVTAQALFDDAKRLVTDKKYAEACPKFEESQRLDPAIGTHFALAECYERAGRLATAWAAYLDVASEAKAESRPDRERFAKARAEALAPRMSRITVVVPAPTRVAGLEIKRDGEVLHEPQWGVAVPVDPGAHVVAAAAPGKVPNQTTVVIQDEGKVTEVQPPPLLDAPAPAPVVSTAAPPLASNLATPPPAAQPRGLGAQRILAIAAGAVGVGGLVVGSIFGLETLSKHSDAQGECQGNACTPGGLADVNDGKSAGNVSTIAFVVGGVALAGGAVLWLTAPSSRSTVGALGVVPLIGRGTGGLSLHGDWR